MKNKPEQQENLKIRKIIQKILEENMNDLNEYGRINDKTDILSSNIYNVYIYGNDREKMTPHFHFFDVNNTFHLEIQIENIEKLKILRSSPRKGIKKNELLTWKNLSKEKKLLKKWLNEKNTEIKKCTNYQTVKITWNLNNPENKLKF